MSNYTMTSDKRNGKKWTINEVLSLQREYELLEWSVSRIAEKHQRSVLAILCKLQSEGFITCFKESNGYYDVKEFKNYYYNAEEMNIRNEVKSDLNAEKQEKPISALHKTFNYIVQSTLNYIEN